MILFSALDEPWIPIRDGDGRIDDVGLRDVVLRAHEFNEIADGSPIVEYGLYRFLITLFMDMLHPETIEDIEDILAAGRVEPEAFDAYVKKCAEQGVSFDFFDRERPFLQTPLRPQWDKVRRPVTQLDYTLPHGSSHVHFDHRNPRQAMLSKAQAARLLPAIPLFCTAAAQGYPSGVNGKPPYYAIVRGSNLFETILFSMLSEDDAPAYDNPPPLWRSTEEVEPKQIVQETSLLYGMLFPARRVMLIPAEDGVREVYFSQGQNFKNVDLWNDPHVAYRITEKGKFPWSPSSNGQPVWLNIMQLVRPEARPPIVDQAAKGLGRSDVQVQLYGVETDQAKYIDSVRHDMRIPAALLRNLSAMPVLEEAVANAIAIANALRGALDTKKLPQIPAVCGPEAVAAYYRMIEDAFWDLISALADEDDSGKQRAAYKRWIDQAAKSAWHAYESALNSARFRWTELDRIYGRRAILAGTIYKIQHPEQAAKKNKNKKEKAK